MSSKITDAMSVDALQVELGRRLADWRIAKHYTQAQLADLAGVSRATLQRLEAGQGGELRTFLSVLMALNRAPALEALLPEVGLSPMDMLKLSGKKRKRVRAPKKPKPDAPRGGWKWGDEQ